MDQEQELTIGEAYYAGYNLGYRMAVKDLEALQAAELDGEYQAMLAEKRADLEENTTGGRWK